MGWGQRHDTTKTAKQTRKIEPNQTRRTEFFFFLPEWHYHWLLYYHCLLFGYDKNYFTIDSLFTHTNQPTEVYFSLVNVRERWMDGWWERNRMVQDRLTRTRIIEGSLFLKKKTIIQNDLFLFWCCGQNQPPGYVTISVCTERKTEVKHYPFIYYTHWLSLSFSLSLASHSWSLYCKKF